MASYISFTTIGGSIGCTQTSPFIQRRHKAIRGLGERMSFSSLIKLESMLHNFDVFHSKTFEPEAEGARCKLMAECIGEALSGIGVRHDIVTKSIIA